MKKFKYIILIIVSVVILIFVSLYFGLKLLHKVYAFPYIDIRYEPVDGERDDVLFNNKGQLEWIQYDDFDDQCLDEEYFYNKKNNTIDLYCEGKHDAKMTVAYVDEKKFVFKIDYDYEDNTSKDKKPYLHYFSSKADKSKKEGEISNQYLKDKKYSGYFEKEYREYYFIDDQYAYIKSNLNSYMSIIEYKLLDYGDRYLTLFLDKEKYSYDREEKTILGLKEISNNQTTLINSKNFNFDGTSKCLNDNIIGGFKLSDNTSDNIIYINGNKMITLYPGYKENSLKDRPIPREIFVIDCDDNYTYYATKIDEAHSDIVVYSYNRAKDLITLKLQNGQNSEKYRRAKDNEMSFIDFSELRED